MAEKTFDQKFIGYLIESDISTLSTEPGVYGVYRCIYNAKKNVVILKALIYIGKADKLNVRINKHEDWDDWKEQLKTNEDICFCYTFVAKTNNERVEAALINSNKPPLNVEYKNAFPFDKTIVNCSGNHEFIKQSNIANPH